MIAVEVEDLINEYLPKDKNTGMDMDTYVYTVNNDVINDNKITILITDMPSRPTTFGSNHFVEKDVSVSIQVYLPEKYPYDFDDITDDIVDLLEENGWFYITSHNASDPETSRSFMMIDLHKTIKRKKEF